MSEIIKYLAVISLYIKINYKFNSTEVDDNAKLKIISNC
jgi:hypothetical protein